MFQDPISSLNLLGKVADIVGAPLKIWKIGTEAERRARSTPPSRPWASIPRWPGTSARTSSARKQRICIARALVLEPKVLICDEPVSALDVSVQAQILNLLEDLKARYGLTLVFITHDLAVVKNVSDRVAVMYLGKLCELARPTGSTPSASVHRRPPLGDPGARLDRARRAGGLVPATCRRPWPRRAAAGSHPLPAPRSAAPPRSR